MKKGSHSRNIRFVSRHCRTQVLRRRGNTADLLRQLRRCVCRCQERQPDHRYAGNRKYDCRQLAAQQRTAPPKRCTDCGRIQVAHLSQLRLPARRRLGRHYGSELPPHRPDAMPRVPRTASPHQSGGRRRHRPQCGDHQKKENLRGHAAICSKAAAERYGMKVLQEGIETNKHNFTRFLVVADPWQVDELNRHRNKEVNKASMVFTLPHTEGSLSQVLSILSFYRINLTKIQSLPIIGREWEYQFYVDVVFDNVLKYKQSIVAITPLTKELKILGEYEDGKSNI